MTSDFSRCKNLILLFKIKKYIEEFCGYSLVMIVMLSLLSKNIELISVCVTPATILLSSKLLSIGLKKTSYAFLFN